MLTLPSTSVILQCSHPSRISWRFSLLLSGRAVSPILAWVPTMLLQHHHQIHFPWLFPNCFLRMNLTRREHYLILLQVITFQYKQISVWIFLILQQVDVFWSTFYPLNENGFKQIKLIVVTKLKKSNTKKDLSLVM